MSINYNLIGSCQKEITGEATIKETLNLLEISTASFQIRLLREAVYNC